MWLKKWVNSSRIRVIISEWVADCMEWPEVSTPFCIAIFKVFCNSSLFSGTMAGGNVAVINPTNRSMIVCKPKLRSENHRARRPVR